MSAETRCQLWKKHLFDLNLFHWASIPGVQLINAPTPPHAASAIGGLPVTSSSPGSCTTHVFLPTKGKGPFSWCFCWCQQPYCLGDRVVWPCTPLARALCVCVHKPLYPSLHLLLPHSLSSSGKPCPHGRGTSPEQCCVIHNTNNNEATQSHLHKKLFPHPPPPAI